MKNELQNAHSYYKQILHAANNPPIDRNQESKLMDPLSINEGLVTRARAKRMKEGLNGLIQEIWAKSLTQHGLDGLEGTSRLQNIIQVQGPVQEH